MDKKDVIDFFNMYAAHWDAQMIRNEEVIEKILTNAQVGEGKEILDVACGTGVLIPDYLARGVKSVTAIDISPEMVKIAQRKFMQEKVNIICGDVENTLFEHKFDCIVVYNAFPHFGEQKRLIKRLSTLLKEGGTLTIAHGMSREQINRHHSGSARKVSVGLISEEELAALYEPELEVTIKIADDEMYQVVGIKRDKNFIFRNILPEEVDQAVTIEQICFPPNEACSEKNMKERIARAPELFLVAVDKETDKIAGFLNGLATDEEIFRDEFFTDASLYNPKGKNIMLLGLDVLPEYRRQGLATEIVNQYRKMARETNREKLILTCLQSKVEMYQKMGFTDKGIANSTWGGEEWHEMYCQV